MKEKAFYTLQDIEAMGPLKKVGKNWRAVCPRCGKNNLSISRERGTVLTIP